MDLTCPKCHGSMRTYERNAVHVDQCTECRGIFLDRGELERLVDAETKWHAAPSPAQAASQPASPADAPSPSSGQGSAASQIGAMVGEVLQARGQSRHGGHYGDQRHGMQYGYPQKRKKSFLEQLFD
jgi:uncharacterized protein